MNYLDIMVSLSLLYALVKGFSNGIIKEITNIISLFLAIYIGIHFSELMLPHLASDLLSNFEKTLPLIAFLLVFSIILIIIKSIGELIDRLTKLLALGLISRFLGAIFGMIKMIVIFCFLILLATDYDIIDNETKNKSILFLPIKEAAHIIAPAIKNNKKIIIKATKESTEKIKETLHKKIN